MCQPYMHKTRTITPLTFDVIKAFLSCKIIKENALAAKHPELCYALKQRGQNSKNSLNRF